MLAQSPISFPGILDISLGGHLLRRHLVLHDVAHDNGHLIAGSLGIHIHRTQTRQQVMRSRRLLKGRIPGASSCGRLYILAVESAGQNCDKLGHGQRVVGCISTGTGHLIIIGAVDDPILISLIDKLIRPVIGGYIRKGHRRGFSKYRDR